MTRAAQRTKAIRDFFIIVGSVFLGLFLARTNLLTPLLAATRGTTILSSVVVGAAFVSLFTAAPAAVILVELMIANSVFEVVFWATIGAAVSDFVIFRFVEDRLSGDARYWLRRFSPRKRIRLIHSKFFRWLMPIVGAFIVASPLPDELGIALIGFSQISTLRFLTISLTLNFVGIFVLGLFAAGLK